jgi:hypothetical protein
MPLLSPSAFLHGKKKILNYGMNGCNNDGEKKRSAVPMMVGASVVGCTRIGFRSGCVATMWNSDPDIGWLSGGEEK